MLRWVHDECVGPAADQLRSTLGKKAEARAKAIEKAHAGGGAEPAVITTSFKDGNAVLQEMGTEQMKQFLRVVISVMMYAEKDQRVLELWDSLVNQRRVIPGTLIVGTSYIPSKSKSLRKGMKPAPFETGVPSAFEVLVLFQCLNKVKSKAPKKPKTGNRVGFAVSRVYGAWNVLAKKSGYVNAGVMMAPYIFYDAPAVQFRPLAAKEDGFAPKVQKKVLLGSEGPSREAGEVDATAFGQSEEVDSALRHLSVMFFEHLHSVVAEKNLTTAKFESECGYFAKYTSKKGALPSVFSTLPEEVSTAIGISSGWFEASAGGGTVSASGAAAPTLSGAGAGPSGQDIGEEEIQPAPETILGKRMREEPADGIEGAVMAGTGITGGDNEEEADAPSTEPEEVGRTSEIPGKRMKRTVAAPSQEETELYDVLEAKVIADMSPWCRMYDIGFQEVMDIDAEVTGDALDGTVAAVIMDPPYNTRSARNSPNSEHDKLSLDDMRNVVEMCDRLLKPGGHGIIFTSVLQFCDWYKYLAEFTEYESEGEESQPMAEPVPTVFNVEEVPLVCIRAPGHYFAYPPGGRAARTCR